MNVINVSNFQNFKLESLDFFDFFLALLYKKRDFITISKDFFYCNMYLFYEKIKNAI